MNVIWKYLQYGRVKHIHEGLNLIESVCGVISTLHLPEQWKTDEEGLNNRPECKGCLRYIRSMNEI